MNSSRGVWRVSSHWPFAVVALALFAGCGQSTPAPASGEAVAVAPTGPMEGSPPSMVTPQPQPSPATAEPTPPLASTPDNSNTNNTTDDTAQSEPFAVGKQLYVSNGCGRCHTITGPNAPNLAAAPRGGPGGGGFPGRPAGPGGGFGGRGRGMRGPELTNVAQDAEHTVEWLMQHVRAPKSHNPKSRMQAFGPDKISDDDLKTLAEYLASLE